MTPSLVDKEVDLKITRDGPVLFYNCEGDDVKQGRQIWNSARDDVKEGHHETLIDGVTTSGYGLTPSAHVFYIYRCLFYVLKGGTWWRTLGYNPNSCNTDLRRVFHPSNSHV